MFVLRSRLKAAGLATLAASLMGCASTDFVKRELKALEGRVVRVEEGLRESRVTLEERLNQQTMTERAARQRVETRVADLEETMRKDFSSFQVQLQEARQLARESRNGMPLGAKLVAREAVFFAFDSADLDGGARARLEAFVGQLKEGGIYFVEVMGHTDDRGLVSYNYRLGLMRAQAVARLLADRAPGKVVYSTVTFGQEKPLLENTNETNRSKNRRVEVRAYRVEPSTAPPAVAAPPALKGPAAKATRGGPSS